MVFVQIRKVLDYLKHVSVSAQGSFWGAYGCYSSGLERYLLRNNEEKVAECLNLASTLWARSSTDVNWHSDVRAKGAIPIYGPQSLTSVSSTIYQIYSKCL